jgi:hypothetical protein
VSTVKLIKYDAACRAIAAAKRVDEVKHIRDVSIAMRAYAKQANNHDLEADAIEIRMRAAWTRCGKSTAAWGFDYKSNHAWGKDKAGTGYAGQGMSGQDSSGIR